MRFFFTIPSRYLCVNMCTRGKNTLHKLKTIFFICYLCGSLILRGFVCGVSKCCSYYFFKSHISMGLKNHSFHIYWDFVTHKFFHSVIAWRAFEQNFEIWFSLKFLFSKNKHFMKMDSI